MLSRSAFRQQAESHRSTEYDELEKRVATAIAGRIVVGDPDDPITVTLGRVTQGARRKILATAQELGWTARIIPDSRDGDYLELR